MIGFENPGLLWLALPLVAAFWIFARVQRRAVAWLDEFVAPRFRRSLTIYGRRLMWFHVAVLFLMALSLLAVAAGPFIRGRSETLTSEGRILFLVDGSASMWADDVERPADDSDGDTGSSPYKRIDVARHVAKSVIRELPDFRFALGSFSGSSVVHLPMTANTTLIEDALAALEVHGYYRNTGSSLAGALDLVPHFIDRKGYRLQVVLLGDGELPSPEDFERQLEALATLDIPVHTMAIGSLEGQSRRILNFQDVVEKKESPRVLREYHTSRVDEHLRRISRKTGGAFTVSGEPGVIGKLTGAITAAGAGAEPFEHEAARTDWSLGFLLAFLAALVLDSVWLGRGRSSREARFEIYRLGPLASAKGRSATGRAGLVLIAASLTLACALPANLTPGGGSARRQAHRENERGIGRDALRKHKAARIHYERSRAFEIEAQIPTYNMARSIVLAGDYSEGHDWFQKALELEPDLAEAHFNDGVTLYLWGSAERDPRNCDLERTRDLWNQALRRFSSARAVAARREDKNNIEAKARANRSALADELDEVNRLIENPPPECLSGSPDASAESGSSDGGSGSGDEPEEDQGESPEGDGEGDEGEDQAPSGGPPPPGAAEPPSGGGGPLSEDELSTIRQQLEALAQQAQESGKYHRRTLPEQFRKGDWSNPDPVIWW